MHESQLWGFLLSPNAQVHELVYVDGTQADGSGSLLLSYPDGFIDEMPCPVSEIKEHVQNLMNAIPGLDISGALV